MGRKHALNPERTQEAVDLYFKDGRSRRQVAAILRVSDMAVRSAIRRAGLQMRSLAVACAATNKVSRQARRKITSVFDLGR